MRILFVTPFYAPEWKFGGPPRKISGLAKELAARGHTVRILTFHSERPGGGEGVIESITGTVQFPGAALSGGNFLGISSLFAEKLQQPILFTVTDYTI